MLKLKLYRGHIIIRKLWLGITESKRISQNYGFLNSLRFSLKGGALYIALIISIVIGIILSVFILIGYFNHRQVIAQSALSQLQWNIESCFSITQSKYYSEEQNCKWIKSNFNDDSIKIKKLQWGAFNLISAESKNRHQYINKIGLFGQQSFSDTAIMITEVGRPINLAGKIKFSGGCYLPKDAFKPSNIEGASFSSEGNLDTYIRQAPQAIPALKQTFVKSLEYLFDNYQTTDSLVSGIDTIKNPFTAKTALFQTIQLHLQNNVLVNNVKLIATNKVVIEKTAHLDNILIIAKKVIIKKGFVGSVNVVASDSIVVEEDCFLKYPSSLTVIVSETNRDQIFSGIFIGEKCKIQGSVIALNKNESSSKAIIGLNKLCEIYGLIYSSNYAGIQGRIYGNIFCMRLLLKTNSGVYENHLLNAELDSKKFGNSIVIPSIFENSKINKCVKWL